MKGIAIITIDFLILIELVELNDYRYHTRSQTYIYHIGIRFVENRGSLKAISTFQFCS